MKKLTLLFFIIIISSLSRPQSFTSSDLPVFVINTSGIPIPNEPKINAYLGIIYNGEGNRNNINDPFNVYDGKIGIEIRGSSSQSFPKKQYGFETRDSLEDDLKVSLLGFPEESDWILSAAYNDKSLMRDPLVYKLANEMGYYASRSKYCEVVINGEYKGLYIFLEKLKRDKNRVDIKKLTEDDTTGNNLTGGYIIKIDKLDGSSNDGWLSNFPPVPFSSKKILYQYHYPKPDDITTQQRQYIKNFILNFEETMYSGNYADPDSGYLKCIDINTFADFFLLAEISKNVDAYRLSAFMYKDRDSENGLLKMGPHWDYNHSLGNADYYDEWKTAGWQLDYLTTNPSFLQDDNFLVPFWWSVLKNDSLFSVLVNQRWNELKTTTFSKNHFNSLVDSIAFHIDEAKSRNFIEWLVLGVYVWPNAYVGATYADEINYLKNWYSNRIDWLESNIPKLIVVDIDEKDTYEIPGNFLLEQNYPNPFNPATNIGFRISEFGFVQLKVYDILGNEVATLVNEEKSPGYYQTDFNAGSSFASGIYYYKLTAGNYSSAKKMILIK